MNRIRLWEVDAATTLRRRLELSAAKRKAHRPAGPFIGSVPDCPGRAPGPPVPRSFQTLAGEAITLPRAINKVNMTAAHGGGGVSLAGCKRRTRRAPEPAFPNRCAATFGMPRVSDPGPARTAKRRGPGARNSRPQETTRPGPGSPFLADSQRDPAGHVIVPTAPFRSSSDDVIVFALVGYIHGWGRPPGSPVRLIFFRRGRRTPVKVES